MIILIVFFLIKLLYNLLVLNLFLKNKSYIILLLVDYKNKKWVQKGVNGHK